MPYQCIFLPLPHAQNNHHLRIFGGIFLIILSDNKLLDPLNKKINLIFTPDFITRLMFHPMAIKNVNRKLMVIQM